jgi:4-amino-4-deoxy-L-arabinose transferase-like glycosyltransferase
MSLVFQIWWGVGFTKLLGYSIEVLRLSTLTVSLLGLIFIYLLLRELAYDWQKSFLVVLLILFNPFSFPLNFTFFTDHFFISLLFAATYFYYKALKDNRDYYLVVASLIASASILVKQNGILIPLAVFLYLVLRNRSLKTITKKGLFSILIPVITLIIFTYWFNSFHGPTAEYIKQVDKIFENLKKPHLFFIKLIWRPILILEFLGFCFLPLSFSLLPKIKELFKKEYHIHLLLFCLAGTIFYLLFEHMGLYPTVDLWRNGYRFAYISEYGYRDFLNILFFFYRILDFLSVVSIVYLIYLLIKSWKELQKKFSLTSPSFVIVAIGIFQFLFLLITLYKFSRYYLALIPFAIVIILEVTGQAKIRKAVFIPLLIAYVLFSLAVTQDVMSWNQVKWQTAQCLLDKGISPRKISAGFAWDAWHSSQYALDNPYEIVTQRGDVPWWIEELVPAIDPEYIIANSPIPSGFDTFTYFDVDRYNIIDLLNYFSFFYLRNMNLYVLQREPNTSEHSEGFVSFSFLRNLKGAQLRGSKKVDAIRQMSVAIEGVKKDAWIQQSPSRVSFKLQLPQGRCRLKASLGMMPSCWDEEGDGVLCKIIINDIFLENFFHVPSSVGIEQTKQFFRPRTFFLLPHIYFIQFIDPKNNLAEREWQDISLDLSTFSGRFIDITFEVSGGPRHDDRCDEALWAHPIIESY